MSHFKSYRSIDQVAHLSRSISTLTQTLETQITTEFHTAFPQPPPTQIHTLAESCLVIDVLGDEARKRLITWYCNLQLKDYRNVFRGNEEAGGLDNISRRYAWLRRILQNYDEEHAQIFPFHWRVNEAVCKAFCDTTRYLLVRELADGRDDYKGILARTGKNLDVKLLLNALQQSLEFEYYLEKRFSQAVFPTFPI
jgi:vacuolar protein sorting-associated protein 53